MASQPFNNLPVETVDYILQIAIRTPVLYDHSSGTIVNEPAPAISAHDIGFMQAQGREWLDIITQRRSILEAVNWQFKDLTDRLGRNIVILTDGDSVQAAATPVEILILRGKAITAELSESKMVKSILGLQTTWDLEMLKGTNVNTLRCLQSSSICSFSSHPTANCQIFHL